MGRFVLAICYIFLTLTLAGCEIAIRTTGECYNEYAFTGIHDINFFKVDTSGSTKAAFLKDWGAPDKIVSTNESTEIWIYERHIWCGLMPIFIIPFPLMLPVCDGFDKVTFKGDYAIKIHTKHGVFCGVTIKGCDPACRYHQSN